MLRSFVTFASQGQVILSKDILSHMFIGSSGVLYGTVSPEETTLLLSPIPPAFWERAFKIIIHTDHPPGSLSNASRAIADLKLDVISSWASAESFEGHLCSTSIVVNGNDIHQEQLDEASPSVIAKELESMLADSLTDLPTFSSSDLKKVRVTPLSVLGAYKSSLRNAFFQRVDIEHHTLRLDRSFPSDSQGHKASIWTQLLTASGCTSSTACIVTPDSEEALLRISVIPETARLCELQFKLSIASKEESFAGYWNNALRLIADQNYSIFLARDIMIKKQENPPLEEAELQFVVDRKHSPDKGLPWHELQSAWSRRLDTSFQGIAESRNDSVKVSGFSIKRPRGVGVPCFFASNAKPGKSLGSQSALNLCRLLEAHGFWPVNIDIARGKSGLQEQVCKLVKSCRFMVILHCPEERWESRQQAFRPSEWVMFEEALMMSSEARRGDILRLRFSSVRPPYFQPGYSEIEVSEEGVSDVVLKEFEKRVARWAWQIEEIDEAFISDNQDALEGEYVIRDLIAYYEDRQQ